MTHPSKWSPERTAAVAAALTVENWSAATVLFALHELGPLTAEQLTQSFAEREITDVSPGEGMSELLSIGLAIFSGPYVEPLIYRLTEDGHDMAAFLIDLISCERKNKKQR